MTQQISIRCEPVVKGRFGDAPPSATVPDADVQALLDLGVLAFLAATYESLVQKYGADSAAAKDALQKFQKMYGFFHINGDTITFDYDEGNQTVTITDPDAIAILKQLPVLSNPPTAADVGTYLNKFWYATGGKDEPIYQKIIEFLLDKKFNMQNCSDTITKTAVLLFYCSLANAPDAQIAGILDKDFLGLGYQDGGMIDLGNIFWITAALSEHLQNDSFFDPDLIAAGLSIDTKDPLYQMLGQYFSAHYKDWVQNPISEADAWQMESRFFPYFWLEKTSSSINAIPISDNTQVEKEEEVEREFGREREASMHQPELKGKKEIA